MKKYLKIIIPLVFISILGFFGYQIYSKIQYKKEVAQNIKIIPEFSFENTKEGAFTKENLKKNTPTLFIYFNSECEFCNQEAQMLHENIDKFK